MISGFTIVNGIAETDGAGVFIEGGVVANCIVINNSARRYGGGIYAVNASVINCLIERNKTTGFPPGGDEGGGGVYVRDGTVRECVIRSNSTAGLNGSGAGVYSTGVCRILNCLIISNARLSCCGRGGGIYCGYARTTIDNCSIVGNTAEYGAGGSGLFGWGPNLLSNCIVRENVPDQLGGDPEVRYSNIQGIWPGERNIDADPLFVAGPLGEFYLSQRKAGQEFNSPCLDAGDGRANELGLKKFTTRTDGRPDKRAVDMGYHYPR